MQTITHGRKLMMRKTNFLTSNGVVVEAKGAVLFILKLGTKNYFLIIVNINAVKLKMDATIEAVGPMF